MPGRCQIRTVAADGVSRPRYLGAIGPVGAVKTSWTVPGGCEQFSCGLAVSPRLRTDALDPGRRVHALRGGSVVWRGILDEPQQDGRGWALSAHGSGTWGSEYAADYTGTWSAQAPDGVISAAIGRGLQWLPPAIGHPAGIYLGQPPDPGSVQVDAALNQMCGPGALTWWVRETPGGPVPQMFPLPTAPTRLLVATSPAPRTLSGDINAIEFRYQSAPDLGAGYPAVYSTLWVTDDASIARHGRMETYFDMSSTGVQMASDVQAVGNFVLRNYQRASFAGPFTARHGELLTVSGNPVDLGCFFQASDGPMVCKLLMTDQAYGGEVVPGPVTFPVGRYEYDEDNELADITPFQSVRHDFASMLASRAAQNHARRVVARKTDRGELWWFAGHSRHRHWRAAPAPRHSTGSPERRG